MKNLFVPYELALKLKEKGFDEPCFAHYQNFKGFIPQRAILASSSMLYYQQENINPSNQYGDQFCTAPLYQQVVDWFREQHNLHINIACNQFGYGYMYALTSTSKLECIKFYQGGPNQKWAYYEAITAAIEEALKLI